MQGRSIDTDSVEEVECPRGREWVGDRKRKKGRGREKKEREGKDSEKNRERRKERGKGSVTNRERKKERKKEKEGNQEELVKGRSVIRFTSAAIFRLFRYLQRVICVTSL